MYGYNLNLKRCDITYHSQSMELQMEFSRAIQKAIRQWSSRLFIYVGSKLIALGQAFGRPLTKPNTSAT